MRARLHPVLALAALVLVGANAVMLTGVAWNRRAPPDSVLVLTQREVSVRPDYGLLENDADNATLVVNWRIRPVPRPSMTGIDESLSRWGAVPWLDRPKLGALGFDLPAPTESADAVARDLQRIRPRDVLLVLELNGPAYAAALAESRSRVAHEEQLAAANPLDVQRVREARRTRDQLERQAQQATRLFVVDAGLEAKPLRARYPDRTRYAIVHGSVGVYRATRMEGGAVYGEVQSLRCDELTIPRQFRAALPNAGRTPARVYALPGIAGPQPATDAAAFQVTLAFGRRFEPWIVDAVRGAAAAPTDSALAPH